MKRFFMILLAMMLVFSFAACGSAEDPGDHAEDEGQAQTKMSEEEIADKIIDSKNWVVGDIWNEGFWLINEYTQTGQKLGNDIDISFAMALFEENMSEKADYDDFYKELSGERYEKLKGYWDKLSAEIESLYQVYLENPVTGIDENYPLNSDIFNQYMQAFIDEADAMYDEGFSEE